MRIQYCSDLHLEFAKNNRWLSKNPLIPSGEILIVAGDTYYLGNDFENLDFYKWASDHYEQTYVIAGNHEYYGGYDLSLHQKPFKWELQHNVFFLNNQSVQINDVTLLFSTFWSHVHAENRNSVARGVNDFYKIRMGENRLSVDDFNQLHAEAFDFLNQNLEDHNGKTVVVTHHLPTPLCNSPEFKGSLINDAFVVDKTDYITKSNIDYWIYGHVHRNLGNGLDLGGTTMLCNQLGYVDLNEHMDFSRDRFVEIE
ncbi:hypothetical protein EJ994_11045 [Maribacter sp. MJ134]|uniref:metallophosphoesterase n=1 Tax=Maribacter sp. MJ134 TaxID=2496865 RepID=UPI000F839498|nr:metallophosphoesterase [Maribacter sp. MJ134]AZQ59316.1 hypothetical protein EJ994_11045 [Maribacter sp. MJ134]